VKNEIWKMLDITREQVAVRIKYINNTKEVVNYG
jgi:hypothetical protein